MDASRVRTAAKLGSLEVTEHRFLGMGCQLLHLLLLLGSLISNHYVGGLDSRLVKCGPTCPDQLAVAQNRGILVDP